MNTRAISHSLSVVGMGAVTGGSASIHELDRALVKGETSLGAISQDLLQLRDTRIAFGSAIRSLKPGSHSAQGFNRDELLKHVIEQAVNDMEDSIPTKELALLVVQKEHHDPVASETSRPFALFRSYPAFSAALADAVNIMQEQVSGVVIASADMLGPRFEKFLEKRRMVVADEPQSLVFSEGVASQGVGEGAAACVLLDHASSAKQRIYTTLHAVANGSLAESVDTFNACVSSSGFGSNELGLFQSTAFNESSRDLEARILTNSFSGGDGLHLAIAGIIPVTGFCGSAHGQLSFIAAALANYHRLLPAVPGWKQPCGRWEWQKSGCYFPEFTRQWFITEEDQHRRSLLSLVEGDFHGFVALSDVNAAHERPNRFLKLSGFHIFPLHAEDWDSLKQELVGLRVSARQEANLRDLSRYYFENLSSGSMHKHRAVIIAEGRDDLAKELELMEAGIETALASGGEFKTPRGSYVTARPLGRQVDGSNGVSLVFPGAGSSYIGIGAEIFHLFPEIYELAEQQSRDVGKVMKGEVIYPRIQRALSFKEKKAREMMFQVDIPSITETDTVYSWICTRIVMDAFAVKPEMAIGYSLGEANMFSSLDVWDEPLELKRRGDNSPIFREQLRGELKSIRKQWGIDSSVPSADIWDTYTFKGDAQKVQELVDKEDRVFLSMINTSDSVVIAGDPAGCKRVIEELGVRSIRMGFVPALHVQPAYEQYEEIAALYRHPVSAAPQEVKMYSTSCYLPVPKREKSIAYAIAKCFCDPVDFPKLVNKLYDDGARIFIEAGAGRACSTWIDKILNGKEHLCVPLNAKGSEDQLTLARTMAKLFCHGVDVDLSPFYTITNNSSNTGMQGQPGEAVAASNKHA